jgi:hypothetical protein
VLDRNREHIGGTLRRFQVAVVIEIDVVDPSEACLGSLMSRGSSHPASLLALSHRHSTSNLRSCRDFHVAAVSLKAVQWSLGSSLPRFWCHREPDAFRYFLLLLPPSSILLSLGCCYPNSLEDHHPFAPSHVLRAPYLQLKYVPGPLPGEHWEWYADIHRLSPWPLRTRGRRQQRPSSGLAKVRSARDHAEHVLTRSRIPRR